VPSLSDRLVPQKKTQDKKKGKRKLVGGLDAPSRTSAPRIGNKIVNTGTSKGQNWSDFPRPGRKNGVQKAAPVAETAKIKIGQPVRIGVWLDRMDEGEKKAKGDGTEEKACSKNGIEAPSALSEGSACRRRGLWKRRKFLCLQKEDSTGEKSIRKNPAVKRRSKRSKLALLREYARKGKPKKKRSSQG